MRCPIPPSLQLRVTRATLVRWQLSKAYAISHAKLQAYPHDKIRACFEFMSGSLFDAAATFDRVLRDHGGWAGVLARSKANAARAIAAEKTRRANKEAKEAKARRDAMEIFVHALDRVHQAKAKMAKLSKPGMRMALFEETPTGMPDVDKDKKKKLELELVETLRCAAENVLDVHHVDDRPTPPKAPNPPKARPTVFPATSWDFSL